MALFNTQKDKLLIELVRNYPVLYDQGNPNFKNCIVKHKAWECISGSMEIPITDIKKRWKHFRDHFHKKLRAQSAGLKSLNTWEYKPHLSFLTEFSTFKEKPKEGHEEHEEPEHDTEAFSPDTSIPVQSVPKDSSDIIDMDDHTVECSVDDISKKKRRKIDTLATVLETRLSERFRLEPSKSDRSPIHKFFESMADMVAEFPSHLAAEARLKVLQVVNEIEMKKLNEQQTCSCGVE